MSTRNAVADLDIRSRRLAGKHYRLIPSRFPPIDVYERLGSPALVASAQRLEAMTNPRLAARERSRGVVGEETVENSPRYNSWNHAPFAYKSPEGSWLLPPAFGALELAATENAALVMAVARRETFLRRTNEPGIELDMRMLVTELDGEFADLRAATMPARDERWALGQTLLEEGRAGAIFHRPEAPRATFVSIFDGRVLGATVQAAHYRFVWNGERIRSLYDFAGQTIDPVELMKAA